MSTTLVPPQAYTKADLAKAYEWLQKQPDSIQDLATSAETLMGLYRKALLYGASSISPKPSASTNEFKSELKQLAGQISNFDQAKTGQATYSSSVQYNSTKSPLPPWAESKIENNLKSPSQDYFSKKEDSSVVLDTYNGTASYSPKVEAEKPKMPEAPQAPTQSSFQSSFDMSNSFNHEPSYERTAPTKAAPNMNQQSFEVPIRTKAYQYPVESSYFAQESGLDLDANSKAMIQEVKRKLNLSSDPEAIRMMLSIGYERIKSLF